VKPASWKDIAEFVGIAAIVASLIFVGLQMRQSQDIAISDGNLANAANRIERNAFIGANPAIWHSGNAGEELDDIDAVVFKSMVQSMHDAAHFEFLRTRRLGSPEIANFVAAEFAAFLFENTGARNHWFNEVQSSAKWRSQLLPSDGQFSDFDELVNSHLSELDRMQD